MRDGTPKTIYRQSYQPPDFLISDVDLAFDIHEGTTRVVSKLTIERNGQHARPLVPRDFIHPEGDKPLRAFTISG